MHHLFIRSYRNDLPWLKYCLLSIDKFATGFDSVMLVCPYEDLIVFQQSVPSWKTTFKPRIIPTPRFQNDYIGQQYSKLVADEFLGNGLVTYMDSDSVFNQAVTPQTFLEESTGNPIWPITVYEPALLGEGMVWKPIVEKWIGEPVNYEYMRRQSITVNLSHLAEFRAWFFKKHGVHLQHAMKSVPNREFSEYNILGAWLHKNKPDAYAWKDTQKDEFKNDFLNQYWSWGGLTPEIEETLKTLTNP